MRMGVTVSKGTEEEKKRHKIIEQAIKEDRKKNDTLFKLLLLGAGESGKSTIVKQMRILHTSGFTESELDLQRTCIIQNILHNMTAIIRAMDMLSIPYENAASEVRMFQKDASTILLVAESAVTHRSLTEDEWDCLKNLWADQGVQLCYSRSNEYQLGDSTKYFCDDLDRISSTNYKPTYDDILHCRVSTLGIVEITFPFRGLTLTIIDVGGQRSQRKKWIHCFEGVNCMIFIAAMSEYNQMLMEDSNTNRMHEALKLFETVCNCQWFRQTPTILFLNKKDLFTQKLTKFPLTLCFPAYTGKQTYEEAAAFVEKEFEHKKLSKSKQIYTHRTCATDTKNVEFVMAASFDIVLAKNMKEAGFT